jgi:hypothetical protein
LYHGGREYFRWEAGTVCDVENSGESTEIRSSELIDVVDYVAVSALFVGALLVNLGVMMILGISTRRMFGAVTVVFGIVLLTTSTAALQQFRSAPAAQSNVTAGTEYRTPVVDGLSVYVGPGAGYARAASIWQVHPGDRLRVVEDTLGWIRFHVKYFDPDWSGWVNKEYTTGWETYQEIQRIQRITERPRRERIR